MGKSCACSMRQEGCETTEEPRPHFLKVANQDRMSSMAVCAQYLGRLEQTIDPNGTKVAQSKVKHRWSSALEIQKTIGYKPLAEFYNSIYSIILIRNKYTPFKVQKKFLYISFCFLQETDSLQWNSAQNSNAQELTRQAQGREGSVYSGKLERGGKGVSSKSTRLEGVVPGASERNNSQGGTQIPLN